MFALFSKDRRNAHSGRADAARARSTTRTALERALVCRDQAKALELLLELQADDAAEPRWPHKAGDLLRGAGRDAEAASAYRKAATLYAERGFVARSRALVHLARTLAGRSAPLRPVHVSIRPGEMGAAGCELDLQLSWPSPAGGSSET